MSVILGDAGGVVVDRSSANNVRISLALIYYFKTKGKTALSGGADEG
jgi:hypothetical protein